jgi:nucleotide-binding universal stress UspA family protein
MYKYILVPTDGSTLSRAAAIAGVKLANSIGARVIGFHAAPGCICGRLSVDRFCGGGGSSARLLVSSIET